MSNDKNQQKPEHELSEDEVANVTGGTTYSAFQNDKTLMRAVSEHDIAPRHDEAISVINGVAWSL